MTCDYVQQISHQLPADVGLWRVDLDAYARIVPLVGLRPAELARAGRMAFQQDAQRFLASRHALYQFLAQTLGRSAESIVLSNDEFGKPRLADGELHFNLSRSGSEAFIGLSRGGAIGVDIEVVRKVPEVDRLAWQHFAVAELSDWTHTTDATRDRQFLVCWTRKEACVKALGPGLSIPLDGIEVGCSTEVRSVGVALNWGHFEVAVCSVRPSLGVVGAVALVERIG